MFYELSRPNMCLAMVYQLSLPAMCLAVLYQLSLPKMCLDESMLLLCCLDTYLLPIRVQIALSNLRASSWTQKLQKLSFHWWCLWHALVVVVVSMARLEILHCLHWPRHAFLMPCSNLLSPSWGRICAVLPLKLCWLPLVVPLCALCCAVLPLVVPLRAVLHLPLP